MILEEEGLIDTILLQSAEFDNQAKGARQRLFDDQILLASNLEGTSAVNWMRIGGASTYALKEMEEISTGLVGNFLRVDGLCGRVCCHHIFECVVGRQLAGSSDEVPKYAFASGGRCPSPRPSELQQRAVDL